MRCCGVSWLIGAGVFLAIFLVAGLAQSGFSMLAPWFVRLRRLKRGMPDAKPLPLPGEVASEELRATVRLQTALETAWAHIEDLAEVARLSGDYGVQSIGTRRSADEPLEELCNSIDLWLHVTGDDPNFAADTREKLAEAVRFFRDFTDEPFMSTKRRSPTMAATIQKRLGALRTRVDSLAEELTLRDSKGYR